MTAIHAQELDQSVPESYSPHDEGHQSPDELPKTPKRKGGRKPLYNTVEERKQRNRQAQAAFRERRTEYIKQLEITLHENQENLQRMEQDRRDSEDMCQRLREQNEFLVRLIADHGIHVPDGLKEDISFADQPQELASPISQTGRGHPNIPATPSTMRSTMSSPISPTQATFAADAPLDAQNRKSSLHHRSRRPKLEQTSKPLPTSPATGQRLNYEHGVLKRYRSGSQCDPRSQSRSYYVEDHEGEQYAEESPRAYGNAGATPVSSAAEGIVNARTWPSVSDAGPSDYSMFNGMFSSGPEFENTMVYYGCLPPTSLPEPPHFDPGGSA